MSKKIIFSLCLLSVSSDVCAVRSYSSGSTRSSQKSESSESRAPSPQRNPVQNENPAGQRDNMRRQQRRQQPRQQLIDNLSPAENRRLLEIARRTVEGRVSPDDRFEFLKQESLEFKRLRNERRAQLRGNLNPVVQQPPVEQAPLAGENPAAPVDRQAWDRMQQDLAQQARAAQIEAVPAAAPVARVEAEARENAIAAPAAQIREPLVPQDSDHEDSDSEDSDREDSDREDSDSEDSDREDSDSEDSDSELENDHGQQAEREGRAEARQNQIPPIRQQLPVNVPIAPEEEERRFEAPAAAPVAPAAAQNEVQAPQAPAPVAPAAQVAPNRVVPAQQFAVPPAGLAAQNEQEGDEQFMALFGTMNQTLTDILQDLGRFTNAFNVKIGNVTISNINITFNPR